MNGEAIMRTDQVIRASILGFMAAGWLVSVGCEHMSHTEKGAGIGAALGTAAGLGIGAATGNPRTGALIGGLAGGGLGALVGSDKDDQERREVLQAQAASQAEAQLQQQRLGIFDVIRLSQAGHDDQVIINQIRTTGSTFQLTPSDLDHLKEQGVSPAVIAAMQTTRPVSPLPPRIVPPPTTVIYQQPVYPAPVFVRPVYAPPPVFVGGVYYRRW
jgi:hypothetical protein